MKTFYCLAVLLLIGSAMADLDYETDGDVITLTDDNFDGIVAAYEYVLVKFYAPWCGHCKKIAPEYKKAATVVKGYDTPIYLGEVDATIHKELGSRFGVKGYPTIKFFIGGEPIEYKGGRDEAGIIEWLNKKTQPTTVTVTDLETAQKHISDNALVGVFFGADDSDAFASFNKVSKGFDDITFFNTNSPEILSHYKIEGTDKFVLYTNFDEKVYPYTGEFTTLDIQDFIEANQYATVMYFDQGAAGLIFGSNNPAIVVFADEDDEEGAKALAALREVSAKLKGKILMSYCGSADDGLEKRLRDFIGIEASGMPTVNICSHSF